MERASRFRRLFRLDRGAADVDAEVAAELDFHLDMSARELASRGMSPPEARREAARRFGDVDLRYAVRGLRRKPAFTVGVVLARTHPQLQFSALRVSASPHPNKKKPAPTVRASLTMYTSEMH